MTIDIAPGADELADIDAARLRAFANSYLTRGHGPVTVTAPSGSGDDSSDAAAAIRGKLNEAGVSWANITGASYRTGESDGQVVVSYTRYVATASECGNWQGLRSRTYRNLRSPNFGCASQNNLAAMVADPHDLVAPSGSTPRDSNRRNTVFEAYRRGEVTAAARDGAIEAEVSE